MWRETCVKSILRVFNVKQIVDDGWFACRPWTNDQHNWLSIDLSSWNTFNLVHELINTSIKQNFSHYQHTFCQRDPVSNNSVIANDMVMARWEHGCDVPKMNSEKMSTCVCVVHYCHNCTLQQHPFADGQKLSR